MVLFVGQFIVSKYAASSAPTTGTGTEAGVPGLVGSDGMGLGLVPSQSAPIITSPTGEIIGPDPRDRGLYGLEGLPVGPAYGTGIPDLSTLPGADAVPGRLTSAGETGGFQLLGKIINVSLPKILSAGEEFKVAVQFVNLATTTVSYQIKLDIPAFSITKNSEQKQVGSQIRETIELSATATSPLPNIPINGTIELQNMTGFTTDVERFVIPTATVPAPPPPATACA